MENLPYFDLSGISGNIDLAYTNYFSELSTVVIAVAALLMIIAGLALLSRLVLGSKSKQYREFLSDMYVAGLVKKHAQEEGIDLTAETIKFRELLRLASLKNKEIHQVIEENLNEKIATDKSRLVSKDSKK